MEGFSGLRRIRGWSSHLILDHGMDVLGIARPGETAGCTPPHPLFWQSQQQSSGLIGLTCANLQTRDNEARHPLARGSNHCSLFSSFFWW